MRFHTEMPRCVRQVALAARWPGNIEPGQVIEDFVNIMDVRYSDAFSIRRAARLANPKSIAIAASEWEGPETQPGSDDDSVIVAPVAARLREFLSQLLGEEELVVEQEWTGVLGFTLDG